MKQLVSKKAEKLYHQMRYQCKEWYEFEGNWDFTSSGYWNENERLNTFKDVVRLCESKKRYINTDIKLNVINEIEGEYERNLINKVEEIAKIRIKALTF